jgi:hypothetical protein
MKTTKIITQRVEVIEDIRCNKCGESCGIGYGIFEGLIEIEVSGGYGSNYIGDGNKYVFSLCEKCLVEFAKTFKIDAFVDGWGERGLADE